MTVTCHFTLLGNNIKDRLRELDLLSAQQDRALVGDAEEPRSKLRIERNWTELRERTRRENDATLITHQPSGPAGHRRGQANLEIEFGSQNQLDKFSDSGLGWLDTSTLIYSLPHGLRLDYSLDGLVYRFDTRRPNHATLFMSSTHYSRVAFF